MHFLNLHSSVCSVLNLLMYQMLQMTHKFQWNKKTSHITTEFMFLFLTPRRWRIWLECSPCMRAAIKVFNSQPRQKHVRTGSDSSTAKCSTIGVIVTDVPYQSTYGTLKNPHCWIANTAEHRSKFAAIHRQWWRLHISEKLSTRRNKQTKLFLKKCTLNVLRFH